MGAERTLDQLLDTCVGCGWEYSLDPVGVWFVAASEKRFHRGSHCARLVDEGGADVTAYGSTPNEALLRAMAAMPGALNSPVKAGDRAAS